MPCPEGADNNYVIYLDTWSVQSCRKPWCLKCTEGQAGVSFSLLRSYLLMICGAVMLPLGLNSAWHKSMRIPKVCSIFVSKLKTKTWSWSSSWWYRWLKIAQGKDSLKRIPSREFYLGGKVMTPQWPLTELKIENGTHFLCFTRDCYNVLLNFSPSFSYISPIHS